MIEKLKQMSLSLKAKVSYLFTLVFIFLSQSTVYAGKLGSSKLAKGTEELIKDATSWMLVIAPVVGVLVVIYFFVRKGMAEEMEHKKWQDRINMAIISTVGAILASVIVNLAISYYK